ncbi:MAG: 3-deoxy-manno-octulosonate cytidylyltransferase [Steroidobacteraceae bacterium]|nr:3-deoxy-manno-octulosonate cytidylyltransferase [Steroidobacteraceae bacterium]MDW8258993.1 3-deoxy-manno-octulosonate cytidylyltransferase [Gammaproteobacteria bacterium]
MSEVRSAAFRVVIPARLASTRLPEKVLIDLAGKSMLQRVWERACASRAAQVLIATDAPRIAAVARGFGAQVEMTAASHASGSERIAEVVRRRCWDAREIVVNVQADEPLLPPELIDQVADLLAGDAQADIATLAEPIHDSARFRDPSVVKVVCDLRGRALYFSRAPIPWVRDAAPGDAPPPNARRHLGLYAYRVAALLAWTATPVDPAATLLERAEQLEQLRALALGMTVRVADARVPSGPDVNTVDDLERVRALLRGG